MKKAFTFLPGHRSNVQDAESGGGASSTFFRRREQLRKAQRTHRLRKDQYFNNLESEVLRLRANELNLVIQAQNLRNQVNVLQGIVDKHEQSILSASFGTLTATKDTGPDLAFTRIPIQDRFNVQNGIGSWASKAGMDFEGTGSSIDLSSKNICSHTTSNHSTDSYGQLIQSTNILQPDQSFNPPTITGPVQSNDSQSLCAGQPFNQKMTDMGMEFVLALEHPCLPHLDRHPGKPNGHALLASSSLIHPQSHQCAPSSHNPTIIFEKLLALSEEFIFDDEISPVQAWYYIVQQSWASRIDLNVLKELRSSLSKLIKCHGFGAVMKRDAFEAILTQTSSTIKLGL